MKDKLQLPQGKQFGVTAESFEEGAEVPHHKRRSFRSQVFQSYTYAAVQTMSEVLVKNLSKLTLDPSIKLPSPLPDYPPQQQEREKKPQGLVDRILSNNRKRSGVRTLLTARKERMERMIRLIQYQRYLNKRSMLQKDLPEQEIELSKFLPEAFWACMWIFCSLCLCIPVTVELLSSSSSAGGAIETCTTCRKKS
ncbi:developmental pluripotency-associated protein 3 isoform X7 [Canis lupus baileyi]|uniref:developmental pluripotency-associated protein 3 isoform X7 n=1 Tax=Canis lupus baileyi TaxID=143281 RepID=UPI000BAA043F|eukprot:XP_022266921.1 uncharacterized protein LOC100856280 isoform X1 [Canis lupus familiaris]